METENVSLLVTPAFSLSFKQKNLYNLSDYAYGEWIIFQQGEPKFYLNIFDKKYDAFRYAIEAIADMEEYLQEKFKLLKPTLSLRQGIMGIRLQDQSFIKNFELEKLPAGFFAPQKGISKRVPKTFDEYVINSIVIDNEFDITQVTLIEVLKSNVLIREEYTEIAELIRLSKLEELFQFLDSPRTGTEYLDVCRITDQKGRQFIVTVYDSDTISQDPQVIDIFPGLL